MTESLAERLAALFEDARGRVATALAHAGISPTLWEQRTVVEPREGGWTTSQRTVEVNALRTWQRFDFAEAFREWLLPARALGADLATEFKDCLPLTLPFPAIGLPLVGLGFTDYNRADAADSAFAYLVVAPMAVFLTSLPSVAVPDHDLVAQMAHEVVDVLSTQQLMVRQSIALDGIDLVAGTVAINGTRLRQLTPFERGELIEYPTTRGDAGALAGFRMLMPPGAVLEVDTPLHITRAQEYTLQPTPAIFLALQLHGYELSGPGFLASQLRPRWIFSGTSGRPIAMRQHLGTARPLTQDQFFAIGEVSRTLSAGVHPEEIERPSELALHRFSLGCGRADDADALLDFVIALEALLLPFDREHRLSDLSYRFRVHGALFMAQSRQERRAVFRQLRHLYDLRSRLVHGGDYPDVAEIHGAAVDARQLAARGLLRAVQTQFPDPPHFNRLVLGELPTTG